VAHSPSLGPLGRHGTARPQPWHARWLELREVLNQVAELARLRRIEPNEDVRPALENLAVCRAVSRYPTPDLNDHERGAWIADSIQGVASFLYGRLTIPVPPEAADQQATAFWYLALCHGYTRPDIARELRKYVAQPETSNPKQWIADRMWATGNRPLAKASPALAELARQVDLRLAARTPASTSSEAATALVKESLDRLFAEDSQAASWMAILAHFAASPIPLDLLGAEIPRGLPHVRGRLDKRALRQSAEKLAAAGLLMTTDEDSLVVPGAIAQAAPAYLSADLAARAVRAAVVLLGMAFDNDCDTQEKWPASERLVDHVIAVANFAKTLPTGREDAVILLGRACLYYRSRAQLAEAIDVGRQAVAIAKATFGENSPKLVIPLGRLAHTLTDYGEYLEAEGIFKHLVELEKTGSVSGVDRAETMNLYGNLLRHLDRFEEAESMQRHALGLFGENRPTSFWRITNDLALTLQFQEHYAEALPLYREALVGLRGGDGSRIVKYNIGTVLLHLGQPDEARKILEEVLAEQEALSAKDAGFMTWIMKRLATAYHDLGNSARAEELYERLADYDQPWVT
jgi:tetratricopeptide (TPR) repeat protein